MLSRWPKAWSARYAVGGHLLHVDQWARRFSGSVSPFALSEATYDRHQPEGSATEEATEPGLMDGFSVPIYGISGFQAGVSFATRELALDLAARGGLQLNAVSGHNRMRAILGGRGDSADKHATQLAPRELECLKWCSRGKTNWEIGEILALSERTVEHYLASAARKLESVTRAQAVAEALRAGVID